MIPACSTPLVDPMWSCDLQSVRHFTCRVDRIQKLRTIIDQDKELLQNLRVCYMNIGGSYNCGSCEKCLRTQMQLMLCGALDACKQFETTLTSERLRHLKLNWRPIGQFSWDYWQAIQEECRKAGFDHCDHTIGLSLRRNRLRGGLKRGGDRILKGIGIRK